MDDLNADASFLSDEIVDMLKRVTEENEEKLRLCRTLLVGFKVTREKDLDYMDGYMDLIKCHWAINGLQRLSGMRFLIIWYSALLYIISHFTQRRYN